MTFDNINETGMLENINDHGRSGFEVPELHVEGLSFEGSLSIRDIANNVFEKEISESPGLLKEWSRLAEGGDALEEFKEAYSEYMADPESLEAKKPDRYDFIREHIFFGTEFKDIAEKDDKKVKEVNEGGKLKGNEGAVISFTGSTMGTTKPSGCDLWVSHGGTITCD